MRPHLIHHTASRHAAALPGLIPDHGPAPLPRERRSWRAQALDVLELLLFMAGLHPGSDDAPPEDAEALHTGLTALQTPGAQLGPVRPAYTWQRPHLPTVHLPAFPVLPALAGRILHRGPRPASADGLSPAAFPVVPTVPTAAGPTGNALGVPLLGAPLVPMGHYLPGEDPRSTTQQLHALTEGALAALDLHYRAIDEQCVALEALALTPLPSEQPPALPADVGFAPGTRRAPGYDWLAVEPQARGAEPRGRHSAGRIAADVVIGGRL